MGRKYTSVIKSGRSWNGFHLDSGKIVHVIEGTEPSGYWGGKALCGSEPGLRSSGWSKATAFFSREDIRQREVTCEKCKSKLK